MNRQPSAATYIRCIDVSQPQFCPRVLSELIEYKSGFRQCTQKASRRDLEDQHDPEANRVTSKLYLCICERPTIKCKEFNHKERATGLPGTCPYPLQAWLKSSIFGFVFKIDSNWPQVREVNKLAGAAVNTDAVAVGCAEVDAHGRGGGPLHLPWPRAAPASSFLAGLRKPPSQNPWRRSSGRMARQGASTKRRRKRASESSMRWH